MNYYHFTNDISFEISLLSVTTGLSLDPSVISVVRLFTRKNGRVYCACYGNNTLINNGNTVTVILNNHGLEAGILQYEVVMQIPDQIYPDKFKKISQYYVSDIELVKGTGQTDYADVLQMFGTTIDGKFNDLEANIDEVSEEVDVISANIIAIQERNSVQDASINHIEDVIATIDGGTSETIQRLNTSVNALLSDVTSLNSTVSSLQGETENIATGLTETTNKVNDVSTRVDNIETVLGRKADVSVLGNYYTKDETYNKDEIDRAIADAAMDGSLPAGIVIDNNYVHTDNNYTNEDKAKVRDFDLSLYPTNSSLVENYATKAELQNVDENHPSNSSVSSNYVKKNDMSNYLSDYPTNSSVSSNYAKKNDISTFVSIADVSFWITEEGYITNNDVSNYVTDTYVNENYVSWENLDEAVFNMIDNNYDVLWKVQEIVNDSSTISDISTNVSDVSVKVIDVSLKVSDISTKLDRDYLSASLIERDYVTNASLISNYTTKDEFNEVWTTGFLTQDSADELYAKTTDISTFISENDASTFITENDFAMHAWGLIDLKNDVVINRAALGSDVSNYMWDQPLLFKTLSDYLSDTYTSKLDMSDYLTNDDVSNFVTTDDISTFITENDASIYLTEADMSNYVTDSSLSENYLRYTVSTSKPMNTTYNVKNIRDFDILNINPVVSIGNYWPASGIYLGQKFKVKGSASTTNTGGSVISNIVSNNVISAILLGSNYWTGSAFSSGALTRIYTKVDSYNKDNLTVTFDLSTYLMTNDDVSTYVSANFASKNDISTFITSNDVSIYATTSYVDTQIGNIQNILLTI